MLDILYRDEFLVAIDKPAGLLVDRSDIDRHETRFAVQLLRDQIGRLVQPLHRLDKGTEFPYADHRELVMDILRFGADVQVLAPADLRERVAMEAKKLVDLYDSKG